MHLGGGGAKAFIMLKERDFRLVSLEIYEEEEILPWRTGALQPRPGFLTAYVKRVTKSTVNIAFNVHSSKNSETDEIHISVKQPFALRPN